MERVQKIEFTVDKQLLVCLGPSLKQPLIKSDFVNFDLSMIYFKAGNDPTVISTFTFGDCVDDTSLAEIKTMEQNPYGCFVAFADCLFVVCLVTIDNNSHLEIIRQVKLTPNSSHR